MLVPPFLEAWRWQWWGYGACPCGCRVEAILLDFGCGTSDLDRRCLESEWLGLSNLASVGVLDLVALASLSGRVRVNVHWVTWRWAPAAGAGRHGTKARGVGCGLRAKLGEVEIGTGTVAHGHGLAELALRPEAVEDDAVDGND